MRKLILFMFVFLFVGLSTGVMGVFLPRATPPPPLLVNYSNLVQNSTYLIYTNESIFDINESKLNQTIIDLATGNISINITDTIWSIDNIWIINASGDLSWNTTTGDLRYYNKSLVNALFIPLSNESNLNVNSSSFWDDLDTPADITTSSLNNDIGFITNLTMNKSVLCSNIDGATSNLCTIVDTDTTYTAGGLYLYLAGTTFLFNETKINETIYYTENFNNIIVNNLTVNDTFLCNGNFSTNCMSCDDGDSIFSGQGIFEDNVTAPNLEIMESLIVHGNSSCSGIVRSCDKFLTLSSCGLWTSIGQRGCHWWFGSCIGTATTCNDMSTSSCSEQLDCVLSSEDGFIFDANGFNGDIVINGNLNVSENITTIRYILNGTVIEDWWQIVLSPGFFNYVTLINFTNDVGYITNLTMNKSVLCSNIDGATSNLCTIVDTDTTYSENSPYLTLLTTVFGFNETLLNETIKAINTNTQWPITGYIINDSGSLNINETLLNETIISFGYVTNSTINKSTNASDIINEYWVNESGDTMTGDLRMVQASVHIDGTSLKNVTEINSNIAGPVFGIYQTGPSGENLPHFILQSGGSSQASVLLRSMMIANEIAGFHNTSNATSCIDYMNEIGEELKIDCNTTTTGADLIVSDDMQVVHEFWLKDTDGEWHFLTRSMSLQDELYNNLQLSRMNVSLSGTNLSMIEHNNDNIVITLSNVETILDKTNDSVTVVEGTNINPVVNTITWQNSVNPTLTRSTGLPTVDYANSARLILGAAGNTYGSISGRSSIDEFIRGTYLRFFKEGAFYESGFQPYVNTVNISIGTGIMTVLLDSHTMGTMADLTNNGSFLVLENGDYIQFNTLDEITEYADGGTISNNKYFNVVWGIIHNDIGPPRIMAVIQNEPSSQYSNIADAEADGLNAVNIFPSNPFLKVLFIPVARTITKKVNAADEFKTLSSGTKFIDIRGSTSSASAPASPAITNHDSLNNLNWANAGHTFDTDLDVGIFNVLGNEFIGDVDCSNIINAASNLCTITDTTYTAGYGLNLTGSVFSLNITTTNDLYVLNEGDNMTGDFNITGNFTIQGNLNVRGCIRFDWDGSTYESILGECI